MAFTDVFKVCKIIAYLVNLFTNNIINHGPVHAYQSMHLLPARESTFLFVCCQQVQKKFPYFKLVVTK
ncbi:MAG: hypothetical protein WC162_06450 [Sphaerochaetaceae bacterium]